MQTHWQMLWPGFRPVWQFPLLREHIRLPSLWTTGIATDYSAFNQLTRLLLACDLVAWVCTFKVFTMIAFRALVWRQTATLWWRTRETTAWRSTSISSRPSSTWSEDLQVSPEDRHLLGLWYFKWSLVVWRVDVRSWSPQWMITTTIPRSTVESGVASPSPMSPVPPYQSSSCNNIVEDNLRERATDRQALQVEALRAPILLVKTYLFRSVLCQIDKHHNINHVFKQLFVVLFGQHAKITNYNHVLSLSYWICIWLTMGKMMQTYIL